jgi:aminoglycoside phosphotransferase (APT) family kinase protein
MYSLSKIPLSAAIAQDIVRHHFGAQRKLAAFEELHEGYFNAAARLELDDGFACVLKAAPLDGVKGLRYEKDILKSEVESMRLVRQRTEVPVAEIYVHDASRRLLPSDFFIMQLLPGSPLHKVRQQLPPQGQVAIERSLGRMAFEISQLTNAVFGYWAQPQPPGTSWRATFLQMLDWVIADGKAIDVKLPLPYDDLYALLERHFAALDEVTTPRLVHWDIWDGNVFVDPTTCQVTGLIDFERVLWGDPLLESFFGDRSPASHYAEGFGQCVLSTRPQVQRRMLYNTYLWLIMIIETFYRHYDNDWQINWATERLKEEIKLLAGG